MSTRIQVPLGMRYGCPVGRSQGIFSKCRPHSIERSQTQIARAWEDRDVCVGLNSRCACCGSADLQAHTIPKRRSEGANCRLKLKRDTWVRDAHTPFGTETPAFLKFVSQNHLIGCEVRRREAEGAVNAKRKTLHHFVAGDHATIGVGPTTFDRMSEPNRSPLWKAFSCPCRSRG